MEQGKSKVKGRPKKVIDYAEVERLASRLCDQKLICEILQISLSTATHDEAFLLAYSNGRGTAKMNLLAKQYEMAMKGNQVLLTWLGKNVLQQAEKIDTSNESHVTITIAGDDKDL